MPTYSRNGIENYRIAENKKRKYLTKGFLCTDLRNFSGCSWKKRPCKETKQADFQNWVSYQRVLTVFIISFFRIYISQSHFKILFPIHTFRHPSPKKANPNFPVWKKANPGSHFTPSSPSPMHQVVVVHYTTLTWSQMNWHVSMFKYKIFKYKIRSIHGMSQIPVSLRTCYSNILEQNLKILFYMCIPQPWVP